MTKTNLTIQLDGDTNVLVYAHDGTETRKQPIARELLEGLWAARSGTLSTQVLQEFYVVATRKLDPPMSRAEAREIVSLYGSWPLIQVDLPVVLNASELEERERVSFWDALIVEAARVTGATRLVTEDLQAGREFDGIRIETRSPRAGAQSRTIRRCLTRSAVRGEDVGHLTA